MMKGEEDRISLLPDCLLVEIISLLPETKYVIRTGTLAKRWQHLWPQLRNLIISRQSAYNVHQFYWSVKRIISQSYNLVKLHLHSNYTRQTQSHVNICIRNAIKNNVQELDFYMSHYPCDDVDHGFLLLEFFFVCSSFIHLKLNQCLFEQAVVVSWENLRTLCIEDAEIDQDAIKSILSGSPLLETLMFYGCYGFVVLDITNKSVKKLVFSGYDANFIYSIEINAPYILSLIIEGFLPIEKLLLLNVPSVIEVELDYYKALLVDECWEVCAEVNEEMLKGLLLSLGHAKEVKTRELCLEALTGLKAKGFIYPSNLKVLGEIDSS